MHNRSLCALGHNSGPDVCSSSECPGETVHLQARLSCRFSHNIIVCLINWHVFQIFFAISYLKKK